MPLLPRAKSVILIATLLPLAACATAARSGERSTTGEVITREQLDQIPVGTAFHAVEQLKPMWLRRAGSVYMNDMRMGELAFLQEVSIDVIQEMRYITPERASLRWNLRTLNEGVIEIITRR